MTTVRTSLTLPIRLQEIEAIHSVDFACFAKQSA